MNNVVLRAINEKRKLILRTRKLRLMAESLESENKELRDRLEKQEWFQAEFKHEMLNRLAATECH